MTSHNLQLCTGCTAHNITRCIVEQATRLHVSIYMQLLGFMHWVGLSGAKHLELLSSAACTQ
jgi:hypothetical protein